MVSIRREWFPSEVYAEFFADFHLLANGHLVVANWQNHGTRHSGEGVQLLEFDSSGVLVSRCRQDPTQFSSLHAVLILDGLDSSWLRDKRTGVWKPALADRESSMGDFPNSRLYSRLNWEGLA